MSHTKITLIISIISTVIFVSLLQIIVTIIISCCRSLKAYLYSNTWCDRAAAWLHLDNSLENICLSIFSSSFLYYKNNFTSFRLVLSISWSLLSPSFKICLLCCDSSSQNHPLTIYFPTNQLWCFVILSTGGGKITNLVNLQIFSHQIDLILFDLCEIRLSVVLLLQIRMNNYCSEVWTNQNQACNSQVNCKKA